MKNFNQKEIEFFAIDTGRDLNLIRKLCLNALRDAKKDQIYCEKKDKFIELLEKQDFKNILKIRDEMLKDEKYLTLGIFDSLIMCWFKGIDYEHFGYILHFYSINSQMALVWAISDIVGKNITAKDIRLVIYDIICKEFDYRFALMPEWFGKRGNNWICQNS